MKLQFQIALKYLFSRKSHSIVNLLSVVSIIAIAITVAAMVFILALQGGLAKSVHSLYQNFDPHLKIQHANNDYFTPPTEFLAKLKDMNNVETHANSVNVNALLQYKNEHTVVQIIGIDSNYINTTDLHKLITHGSGIVKLGDIEQLIVGQGVAYNLGVNPAMSKPAHIYSINQTTAQTNNIATMVTSETAFPSSVFVMDKQLDEQTVIASIELARKVAAIDNNQVSAINVKLKNADKVQAVKKELRKLLGDEFIVADRIEQRPMIFKFINIERGINIMLLSVIIVVASLSLVGSTVTMISEKRNATNLLKHIGMSEKNTSNIFLSLGAIITLLALSLGLILGIGISLAQLHFGFLQMGAASFLFDAYPIDINLSDILIVAAITLACSISIIGLTIKTVKTQ